MTDAEAVAVATPPPASPSRSESMQLRWRAAKRSKALPVVLAALLALAAGVALGRATAANVDEAALAVVARDVLPLAVDADALWTAGTGDLPPVGAQLLELRRTGDPDVVLPHVAAWDEAYETVLRRLIGVDVPPAARPIQRQLVTSVTLSRDAIELVATAAEVSDPATRRELTSEALRVRLRAEQIAQMAQASSRDLDDTGTSGVSVPPPVPSLEDLR